MMNFDYLKQYDVLAPLYRFCDIAERHQLITPQLSALNARLALEWMAKEIHKMKGHVPDERDGIYDLVADPIFTEFINDDRVMMGVHYVRKIGNNAAHTGNVSKREAFFTLLNLYNFVGAVLMKLRVIDSLPEFDGNLVPKEATPTIVTVKPKPVEPEPETVETDFAATIPAETITAAADIESTVTWDEISEAETRRLYIDTMLEEAGWEVVKIEGSKVAAKACIEVEIPGMPNPSGVGYADYILFGRDLKPLAVIEAKRTSVDPNVGKQQAILYADCLKQQYGVRPAIYYTNGFETHFIDGIGYPSRRVYAFHTREDLEVIIKKRDRKDITDIVVNEQISGRYYQIMAVKKMCEWLNGKHRRGLLVMATGTGKTRTAISLVDVLQKAGWVKNTLFLADRTSLVSQAQKDFDKWLPQTTTTILNESQPNMDARIMFSTYQTMIKKINTEDKPFSVGRFDLIIIDEAHRSVFGKYGAIFNYFDSFLVGLTATPRDQVDKSTYDLLELDGGEPNFAYEYRQAQEDKFLVPYRGFQRGSAVVNQGIKYDDLTPEEQKQLEEVWEYEEALNGTGDGPQPRDVESPEIYKYIFNIDTVDKVLQDLMEHGLKIDGGEKIGKTIIFAFNAKHAQLIVDRFNLLYPQYGDKFCAKIDYSVKYADTLIDSFCEENQLPQIAVSVDMLDTGIDVTSCLNLVFFKRVRSRIKFDQMIGRGTRLHPGLFGNKDKEEFYIFDWCGNFAYFGKGLPEPKATKQVSLTEKLFNVRCEIASILQAQKYQEDEFAKEFHDELKEMLHAQVTRLNDMHISVREHLACVSKYRNPKSWEYIGATDVLELQKEISPLLEGSQDDVNALRFDLLALYVQLGIIDEEFNSVKYESQIQAVANALRKKASIPEVAAKMDLLNAIFTKEFWENKSLESIEKMRLDLRDLIKYLDGKSKRTFTKDIEDTVTDEGEVTLDYTSSQTYREKVIDFLNNNRDLPVLQKISNIEQLTEEDITELERILWEQLGTKEDYDRYLNRENLTVGDSVGAFIRHLNGVDRQKALQMFTEYISQNDLTADQEEYLKSILDYVCQNGDMTKKEIVNNHFFAERLQEVFPDKAMQVLLFVGYIHQSITAA